MQIEEKQKTTTASLDRKDETLKKRYGYAALLDRLMKTKNDSLPICPFPQNYWVQTQTSCRSFVSSYRGKICLLALFGRRNSLAASAGNPSANLASARQRSSGSLYCSKCRCKNKKRGKEGRTTHPMDTESNQCPRANSGFPGHGNTIIISRSSSSSN